MREHLQISFSSMKFPLYAITKSSIFALLTPLQNVQEMTWRFEILSVSGMFGPFKKLLISS